MFRCLFLNDDGQKQAAHSGTKCRHTHNTRLTKEKQNKNHINTTMHSSLMATQPSLCKVYVRDKSSEAAATATGFAKCHCHRCVCVCAREFMSHARSDMNRNGTAYRVVYTLQCTAGRLIVGDPLAWAECLAFCFYDVFYRLTFAGLFCVCFQALAFHTNVVYIVNHQWLRLLNMNSSVLRRVSISRGKTYYHRHRPGRRNFFHFSATFERSHMYRTNKYLFPKEIPFETWI